MDTATAHQVLTWLHGQEAAMSALLGRLVLAESPSTDPAAQQTVRDRLTDALGHAGFRVHRVFGAPAGDHLFAVPRCRQRGLPYQLLLGHFDTVWPLDSLTSMPFEQRDGRVTGPGVFDMKAGLVQAIFALDALQRCQLVPPATPLLFVNSDEEVGSGTSYLWITRLARLSARAFVLEPAFGPHGALKTARKGVGQFRLRVAGRAAHAGVNPEAGLSAILELSHQVQRLFALNDPAAGVTVNVGTIDGGLRPNVVAPVATAVVDVRVPTLEEGRRIEAAIRGLQPVEPGIVLEVEGSVGRPPLEPTPRNQALWRQAVAAGALLGLDLQQAAVGGASDGNYTSLYTATLDGLGPVGDGAHALHEYVEQGRLAERAALLALLLLSPIGGSA
jgi:glutamate carboxypeptidase